LDEGRATITDEDKMNLRKSSRRLKESGQLLKSSGVSSAQNVNEKPQKKMSRDPFPNRSQSWTCIIAWSMHLEAFCSEARRFKFNKFSDFWASVDYTSTSWGVDRATTWRTGGSIVDL
jgi:hypothetical protein